MHKKSPLIIFVLVVIGIFLLVKGSSFVPVLWQLLFNRNIDLKQTKQEQINVLLLGTGGGNHEGPNLSDTIIFASVDPKKNIATLVSLPRDLWVPDLAAKINTAYAFGEEKQKGGGIVLAKAVVEKILNQPISYVVRVDFDGFVKAVDLLGGIDVMVERTFDDYEYPIEGKEIDLCGNKPEDIDKLATASALDAFPCRYKHIHFNQGNTHMNGETALTYVRSRHALGPEGTDFARSKRQENVLSAFKAKLLTLQVLIDPVKLIGLYNAVSSNVDTDIKKEEFDDFVRLAQKMKGVKMQSAVIDYGDEQRKGLLINPPISSDYGNQWVLIPRNGADNYGEIQTFVSCVLTRGKDACANSPTPTVSLQK